MTQLSSRVILREMKRAAFALVAAALIASGCGAASNRAATDLSTSPPTAAASGTLSCRLPVAGFVPSGPKGQPNPGIGPDGQDNQKGTGGFLDVATGKFTPDATSDRSYLAAAKKWLPVSAQDVSPNQLEYVQGKARQSTAGAAPTTTLYIVRIATGASRLLFTAPDGDVAFVLGFTSRGIYVETASSTGPGATVLLLIDPTTGTARPVAGAQTPPGATYSVFTAISGDFAWGTRITGSQQQPLYQLVRLDLTDGTIVDWDHSPTMPHFVIGFDENGHPIVAAPRTSPDDPEGMVLLSAPDRSTPIPTKGGAFLQGRGNSVTDSHGTWFGSADGDIWLYSTGTGLERIAVIPPQPGGTGQPYDERSARSVAGPCV